MNPGSAAAAPAPGRFQAALAARAQGQLQEALNLVSDAAEYSRDTWVLRGDLQLELGLLQDAVATYSTILAHQGDDFYARQQIGFCFYRMNRWEAAVDSLQRFLQQEPHRDSGRVALGDCLLHLNRFEEALDCFDQCWSEAERLRALFGKALALQSLRRFDEAELNYERLLALDPGCEEALSNLIALAMEVLDMARVERYSLQLFELSPDSIAALQGLIVVAVNRGQFEAGALRLQRLLEIVPCDRILEPSHRAAEPERLGREKGSPLVYCLGRANSEKLDQAHQGLRGADQAPMLPRR